MKEKSTKQYLSPNQVAELLMITPIRVRQLAKKGALKSMNTPGGHRRYLKRDVEMFAREKGLILNETGESSIRILIVDNDAKFTGYLQDLFLELNLGFIIEISQDGFDAGRKIQTFKPNIVLLDLMMPGLSGFEVCRQLKEDPYTKHIRVIAITGYSSKRNKNKILQAGAEACLSKPIEVNDLLALVGIKLKIKS